MRQKVLGPRKQLTKEIMNHYTGYQHMPGMNSMQEVNSIIKRQRDQMLGNYSFSIL